MEGGMFGEYRSSAANTHRHIMLEASTSVAFRESCRALFVVDISTLKDPGDLVKLIRDRGLHRPDTQLVLDAVTQLGRSTRGRTHGDGHGHHGGHEISASQEIVILDACHDGDAPRSVSGFLKLRV